MSARVNPYDREHPPRRHPDDDGIEAALMAFARRLLAEIHTYRRIRRMHTAYGHRRGHQ